MHRRGPVLYQFLSLRSGDPLHVWRLPKDEAIELLSADEPAGREIRAFYSSVLRYYGGDQSVAVALEVIKQGVTFIRTAAETLP